MTSRIKLALMSLFVFSWTSAASAQSLDQLVKVFGGEWYIFDAGARSDTQPCALTLKTVRAADFLPVQTEGCAPPIALIDRWSIRDGQIVLATKNSEVTAVGGNQFRMTGELNETDTSLVIERAQGDGNSARIAGALRKHKCFFLGFTQKCATPKNLVVPEIDADVGFAKIETLATLNARAQPRRDAPSLGNIALGTDVVVQQCLTASDGPWCSARIGDSIVWLAMTAIRQDEWPIVTFQIADSDD